MPHIRQLAKAIAVAITSHQSAKQSVRFASTRVRFSDGLKDYPRTHDKPTFLPQPWCTPESAAQQIKVHVVKAFDKRIKTLDRFINGPLVGVSREWEFECRDKLTSDLIPRRTEFLIQAWEKSRSTNS